MHSTVQLQVSESRIQTRVPGYPHVPSVAPVSVCRVPAANAICRSAAQLKVHQFAAENIRDTSYQWTAFLRIAVVPMCASRSNFPLAARLAKSHYYK